MAAAPAPFVLNLEKSWQAAESGTRFPIPFQDVEAERIALTAHFSLTDSLIPDSLYLYFEGVSWRAELELNDVFLGVHQNPFQDWVVPIARNWFRPGTNTLSLILQRGAALKNYPEPFLGIFRPNYLFTEAQLEAYRKEVLPQAREASKVALIAPYYRSAGYIFDSFEAARNLLPLRQKGITHLSFIFPPGREMREMCARLGFQEVRELTQAESVAPINAYPFDKFNFGVPGRFWLDMEAYRTANFGDFTPLKKNKRAAAHPYWSYLLVLLAWFPLLSMYAVKSLSPGFFMALPSILVNPKLFIDSPSESAFSQRGLVYLLLVVKALSLSVCLALGVWYLQSQNQWSLLATGETEGLLQIWFGGITSLSSLLIQTTLLFLTWVFLKLILFEILGRFFRIKNFAMGLFSLELVASYPLVLGVSIPLALLYFQPEIWGGWVIWGWLAYYLLYLLRKIYVMYIGLERVFSFSTALNFLYICTFNILPYLFLL
ncbi:MAG: DUF4271 domain-containing protein [Bacteroidota bacterium]